MTDTVPSCQKGAFSLPEGKHYLNCAYMSPLPRAVEAAGIEGLRRKRDPTRIEPPDFFRGSDRVRERFARLTGTPEPRRVAILPSASYGLAIAARNSSIGRGQNVIVAAEQFPSNVLVWRRLCHQRGAELRTVKAPAGHGRGAGWSDRLHDAIDAATAVVALGHVHWTDGTRFDLEVIGARARQVGAALVVDGTQSVGALPFDVERLRPDALVCSAYKWLLGPFSLALGYLGSRYDDGVPLEESWLARAGSDDFQQLVDYRDEYRPGALRYDVGQRENFALLPMLEAALDLLLAWTPSGIQAYCERLMEPLLGELDEAGYSVEDSAWRGAHLFGLRAPEGLDLRDLARGLRERNVFVSLRGTALRVSPHLYNDSADVAALRAVLLERR